MTTCISFTVFSPAQFVHIIAIKQTRNIPDRGENVYGADYAFYIFLPYKLSRQPQGNNEK